MAPPIEISSKEDLQELAQVMKRIAEKKPFSEMENKPSISGKPGERKLKINLNPNTPNRCVLAYRGRLIALVITLDDDNKENVEWHVSLSTAAGSNEISGKPLLFDSLPKAIRPGRISDALASEILEVFFGEAECRELNVNVLFKNVRHFFCSYK